MRYAYPSTSHIASFKSFGARCCSGSPAWSKALTGVSFTRAYDDEGGTEDTTARSHRQHYQLLPRAQWEGEGRGMGTSDEGAGEKQNQDVFEWCEEDRCRLYRGDRNLTIRDCDWPNTPRSPSPDLKLRMRVREAHSMPGFKAKPLFYVSRCDIKKIVKNNVSPEQVRFRKYIKSWSQRTRMGFLEEVRETGVLYSIEYQPQHHRTRPCCED